MSTCVLLPEGKHKHRVGTSEVNTGFLNIFRGLWKPAAQTVDGPLIQPSNNIDIAFLPVQPSIQIGKMEEDLVVTGSNIDVSSSQGSNRSAPSNIYTVKKCSSNGNSSKRYRKISTSSILPTIRHQNIDPWDLLNHDSGTETGHDYSLRTSLDTLIYRSRRLAVGEADSYFKQVLSGVEYLHNAGIAHRDLNPENLMLTTGGTLKIKEFSHAEHFRLSGGGKPKFRMSSKKCGSLLYLAPEVFVELHFDPRPVDMWALGIIYMEMRTGKLFWNFAAEGGDEYYDKYLQDRRGLWGYRPIENLENVRYSTLSVHENDPSNTFQESCRDIIRSLLEPSPRNLPSASQVLKSVWCAQIAH